MREKTVPLGTVFVVESVPEWVAEVFEVYEVFKMFMAFEVFYLRLMQFVLYLV